METPTGPAPAPVKAADAAAAPIGESELGLIRQAVVRRRKMKSAAGVARSSAIVTLVIGFLALPFVLWSPSLSGVVVVVGVITVGVREWMGYEKMRRAETGAAGHLGWNQVALVGVITFYCLLQMASFSPEEMKAAALSPEVRSLSAALPGMMAGIDKMVETWAPYAVYGFYSLLIVVSIGFQGGMALYYFSRRKYVEAFNRETPAWVRKVLVEVYR
ncbi:MAG: hypothetical protein WBD63_03010 [Phycisphaerae bacterium]|nr:hypothetical protein [Phycisphaerae bacterium]